MNLQEKLSGLKGLVTHSHSKRRCKADLTADMISPPLGDFRHTMHVGRGGEVFGDTSFLSNHGGSANGGNGETDVSASAPDNKLGAFFSRTLRQIRRGSDNRIREGSKDVSQPPPAVSPIIKNAVSLPRLDVDMYNGSPTTKVLFPSSHSTPGERKSSYGLESGFVTLPRLSRSERQQPSASNPANAHRGSLTDPADPILTTATSDPEPAAFSSSLASLASLDAFNLDLGPSLMSEVFGLLDGDAGAWERDETGWPSGMDSPTVSYADSPLREERAGEKDPQGAGRDDDEASGRGRRGSLERARSAVRMESERFRSAANALARHYGGRDRMEAVHSGRMKKMSYSYTEDDDDDDDDDDDEIKV
ncbi:cdc42 effector protein 1 [Festucalex cinctus]